MTEPVPVPNNAKRPLWYLKITATSLTVGCTLFFAAFVGWLRIASRSAISDNGSLIWTTGYISWGMILIGALATFSLARRGEVCHKLAIACVLGFFLLPVGCIMTTSRLMHDSVGKYSHTQGAQRDIASGVNQYLMYNGNYPTSLNQLTTPVAHVKMPGVGWVIPFGDYMCSYPVNLLSQPKLQPHDYYSDGKNVWIVRSVGLDGDEDIDLEALAAKLQEVPPDQRWKVAHEWCEPHKFSWQKGGLIPPGDVYLIGP
jgi:hypothetical protein